MFHGDTLEKQARNAVLYAASNFDLSNGKVWIVIPCYKVKAHIARVIDAVPEWVEGVVCVDDKCPDGSADFIESTIADPRVVVLRLPQNRGVGGAVMAGYLEAERRGARTVVKVDGDDQMDLAYLPQLVAPILLGEADYTKGNRFTSISHISEMPRIRIFGNAALSFLAKLSTGYWNIFDPTNGYTAIDASLIPRLATRRVAQRFFFETDVLYHLGTLRAVARDIPIPAKYGDEVSNLKITSIIGPFALKHLKNLVKRIIGQYFVRDFNVATLEFLFGLAFLGFGSTYALRWFLIRVPGEDASAGVVMAAALPIIVGAQLLLQAMNFDVLNVPNRAIHPYLRAIAAITKQGKS
ncbi:glycosyltransferase family 2 protein [Phenylobacterium sp. 58.2.17]|uniref:glycosyltransferase family 2 protein n=1 Tax=Phenylobacterium sp. 58.2.17 TaxID=2969306 RepID=UPI002263B3F7|nr:glycosyltransferase family 2 protein [Phenylobacterium sp. 58.2.17]MCX7585425.1 glycosyltransferase family 2 protein [Phenylobacterium sp. 58.2.17]